jgi:hypothetical protein
MITFAAVSQTEQLPGTQDNLRELIMQRLFHDEISLPQRVRQSLRPWQHALLIGNAKVFGATRQRPAEHVNQSS